MPIETRAAWFLLPHQDDEVAVLYWIEEALSRGLDVRCIFFTQAPNSVLNDRRNAESLDVLSRLGVGPENILFEGMTLGIMDGQMQDQLNVLGCWLQDKFSIERPEKIWIPAWEGGHPDHDALHAAVVEMAARAGILERVQQFSFYNGWGCSGPWFRVMHPLTENGPVECRTLQWQQRLRYLMQCLKYPSQAKTWLGLFPFFAAHLAFKGVQQAQRAQRERILQRPHPGPLYYEKRAFSTWEKTQGKLEAWIKSL